MNASGSGNVLPTLAGAGGSIPPQAQWELAPDGSTGSSRGAKCRWGQLGQAGGHR